MLRACGAILVFVMWTGLAFAQENEREPFKVSIFVAPFVVDDLTQSIAAPLGYGRDMAEILEVQLQQSRRFNVLTRTQESLDQVFNELALGEAGVTNADDALAFGRAIQAEVVITGTIRVYSGTDWAIFVRFIDIGRALIGEADRFPTTGPQGFEDAARRFVELALNRYPLRGSVVEIVAGDVFINIGRDLGLSAHSGTGAIYRPREIAGRSISDRIGTFSIRQVYEDITEISVDMQDGVEVRIGDLVEVLPVGDARAAPTGPAFARVSLDGLPVGAVVSVGGEVVGSAFELAPGRHVVVVRAEGFVEQSLELVVAAGEVVERSVVLEPLPGVLVVSVTPADARVLVDGVERGAGRLDVAPGAYVVRVEAPGFEPVEQRVSVAAGQEVALDTELRTVAVAEDAAAAAAPDVVDEVEDAVAPTASTVERLQPTTTAGVLTLSSDVEGTRFVLTDATDAEIEVFGGVRPVDVLLPSGLYFLTASVPGARPIDDVVGISVGTAQSFEATFGSGRVLVSLGSAWVDGSPGTLVLVTSDGPVEGEIRVSIAGPDGWNGGNRWTEIVDFAEPFYVVRGADPAVGPYRVEVSRTGSLPIEYDVSVVARVAELDGVAGVRAVIVDAGRGLSATWVPVEDAVQYVVRLLAGDAVRSLVVDAAEVRFDGIADVPQSSGTLCVTAVDWQVRGDDVALPLAAPRASQACTSVALREPESPGRPERERPTGPGTPRPIDPPPPPPPPPPP